MGLRLIVTNDYQTRNKDINNKWTRAATIDRQRCVTRRSNNIVDRVVVVVVVMSAPSRLRIFNILVDEHVTLAFLFFRDHEEVNSEKKIDKYVECMQARERKNERERKRWMKTRGIFLGIYSEP